MEDNKTKKPFNKKSKFVNKDENGRPLAIANIPEHLADVGMMILGNNDFRRCLSKQLLKYLKDNNVVDENCNYVQFKYDKFSVKSDNLVKEYSYKEPYFVKCCVDAFSCFAEDVQRKLSNLCREENITLNKE